MMRLPTIGLSRPPSAPGGGVISVKTASESPENPCQTSSPRIATSQPSPSSVAPIAKDRPHDAVAAAARGVEGVLMASPDPALDARQHVARGCQHDEGDDEQD